MAGVYGKDSVSAFSMPSFMGFMTEVPIKEGVKQYERSYCRRRRMCGGHSVLLYPGRGAGGQMDGGNAKERGNGCRQGKRITGILCIE